MAGGYTGRILNVDLSGGTISEESLQEKLLRDFVGGVDRRLTIVSGLRREMMICTQLSILV